MKLTNLNRPIDARVGGLSKIKVSAVKDALSEIGICTVIGESASSGGVNEQPIGVTETLKGSISRALSAWEANPTGDIYFGIESGVIPILGDFGLNRDNFFKGNWTGVIEDAEYFVDVPFISIWVPSCGVLTSSTGRHCEFSKEAVFETAQMEGGFRLNTVGKTLAAKGIVKDHADPQRDLMGVPRQETIKQAVWQLLRSDIVSGLNF